MFQDRNGVWRSDDETEYNTGSGWVACRNGSTTTTQETPATAHSSPRQHIIQQSHREENPGTQLSSPEAQSLGDAMTAIFGQSSKSAYRQPQPPNGPFGTNRQIPGMPAVPQTSLDPAFRDAGKRDELIRAFVSAHDKMNRGAV